MVIVVDATLAVGVDQGPCVRAVRSERRRRGRGSPHPDKVVDALVETRPDALVLAQPPGGDADALPVLARVMGVAIVRLPLPDDLARWVVALAAWLCRHEYADLRRRVETLAGVGSAGLPERSWGSPESAVPALRPAILARWAWHAWRACDVCSGGGYEGAPCARCGTERS